MTHATEGAVQPRFIILEDSPWDAELLKRELRKEWPACETLVTAREDEFVRAISSEEWSAIFSDFNLPSYDAVAALESLKQSGREIPFFVLSGAIGEEAAVSLVKAGVDEVLLKDNLRRIVPTLKKALREYEARRKEREARAVAEQAVSAREHMLSVISHDLKSPLSSILLTCRQVLPLMPDGPNGEDARKHFNRILKAAHRMQTLIHDVLDQTKIESGRFAVEKTWGDAGILLQDLTSIFGEIAAAKGVEFRTEIAADSPGGAPDLWGSFDDDRLFQALSNLVSNAIKFTPPGRSVWVRIGRADDRLHIEVGDAGPGIDPRDVPHVFDRYYQSARHRSQGTGLGLYIARGIVQAHDGEIELKSEIGQGCRFSIRLPAGRREGVLALGTGPARPERHGKRILIVDDDEDLTDVLSEVLRASGFETAVAPSGARALEEISAGQPAAILLDYSIPGMSAEDFVRRVNDLPGSRPPVLLLSGQRELGRLSKSLGLLHSLSKPPQIPTLLEMLDEMTQSRP